MAAVHHKHGHAGWGRFCTAARASRLVHGQREQRTDGHQRGIGRLTGQHAYHHTVAVAQGGPLRGRAGQVNEHVHTLLLDPQGRHLGERRRFHTAHAPLQHTGPAPALDAHGAARTHLQGIGGQQRRHHLQLRGVAQFHQHRPQRHHSFAGLGHAQHPARDRGAHLKHPCARRAARALHHLQRSAGLRQVGTRRALVLLCDLDILAGQCKRQALGIAPCGGDKALLRQLLCAARIALGLLQRRTAACRAHVGPLHPRLRGFHPGLLLTQAACIKQGGQGRCDARQHIARLHRVAFAQVQAQQAPRQRGRNAVAVPQAGAGIVVYACFEAALHHRCHFDLHRPGCKCPGQQRGQRQRRSAAVCHGFLVHCGCFSSCRFQSLRGRVIRAF